MKRIKITIAAIAALIFTVTGVNAQTKEKTNNTQTPVTNALAYIAQLQPLSFGEGKQYGFIADDVQQVLPGVITTQNKWLPAGKNSYRTVTTNTVDYDKLIPILVSAIKEQQAEIELLKSQMQQLKSR